MLRAMGFTDQPSFSHPSRMSRLLRLISWGWFTCTERRFSTFSNTGARSASAIPSTPCLVFHFLRIQEGVRKAAVAFTTVEPPRQRPWRIVRSPSALVCPAPSTYSRSNMSAYFSLNSLEGT